MSHSPENSESWGDIEPASSDDGSFPSYDFQSDSGSDSMSVDSRCDDLSSQFSAMSYGSNDGFMSAAPAKAGGSRPSLLGMLPDFLWERVFAEYLSADELVRAQQSCRQFGGRRHQFDGLSLVEHAARSAVKLYKPTLSLKENETWTYLKRFVERIELNSWTHRLGAGYAHSAVVTSKGQVFTFGSSGNSSADANGVSDVGQLGHGEDVAPKYVPQLVQHLANADVAVVQVSTGFKHTVMLSDEGQVYTCGSSGNGEQGHGQLGLGAIERQTTPALVESLAHLRIVSIESSAFHTAVLTADGLCYTFGTGRNGRLGHGSYADENVPKLVRPLCFEDIVQLALGWRHNLALTASGKVYSWGYGGHGRLGLGATEEHVLPTRISSLGEKRVVQIAAGTSHSLCLTDDRQVYVFGWGEDGNLGLGSVSNELIPRPVVGTSTLSAPLVRIAAGRSHTVMITEDSRVYVCGYGSDGRLGLGPTTIKQLVPQEIESLRDKQIIDVALGVYHTLYLTASGEVLSCGYGDSGRLGNGSELDRFVPTPIERFCAFESGKPQVPHLAKLERMQSSSVLERVFHAGKTGADYINKSQERGVGTTLYLVEGSSSSSLLAPRKRIRATAFEQADASLCFGN